MQKLWICISLEHMGQNKHFLNTKKCSYIIWKCLLFVTSATSNIEQLDKLYVCWHRFKTWLFFLIFDVFFFLHD